MDGLRHAGAAQDLLLRPAPLGAAAPDRLDLPSAARVIGGLCVLSWLTVAGGLALLLS